MENSFEIKEVKNAAGLVDVTMLSSCDAGYCDD